MVNTGHGETCDPPDANCRQDCTYCGDGLINGDEWCDFNDPNAPEDCSDECQSDKTFCGDMLISPGETCEPPGQPAGASGNECRYDCTVCGDGELQPEEFCDDGNHIDEDGYRNDCTACGDGVVDPTVNETCDPPGQPFGSGDLVQDGSFEAGTPNPLWTESSTNVDSPICHPASCGFDLAADGDWWTWFGGTSAEEEALVSQPIALPEGASATLQFALWLITCSGETSDFFEVKVNDDVVFAVDLTDPRCDSAFYTLETVDLSAHAGQGIVLEFRAVTGTAGAAGNIFLDLVSLQVFGENICRADCTVCGDGVVDSREACDDGNNIDSDMCRNDCTENPLLVGLEFFTAEVVKSGVLLRWSTYSERETLGFRLWRSGPTPTAGHSRPVETVLHTGMIFGRGSEIEGAEYRFLDNAQLKPGAYVYYLEDVDNLGVITRHDPVSVEIQNGQSPQVSGHRPSAKNR